jgi:hypothetical protein
MKSFAPAGPALSCLAVLAGCGGGPGQGSPDFPPPPPPPPPSSLTISGSISGLQGSGLVLGNAASGATVAVDPGATSFSLGVSRDLYNIVVISSPVSPSQACAVIGGLGYAYGNVSSVAIECTRDIGRLGGTITGLTGSGLELVQSNGDVVTPAAGASDFAFATGLAPGMRYSIGIGHQPVNPAQTCTLRQGKGVMPAGPGVEDIAVDCIDNVTSPLWGTYGFETSSGGSGYLTFFPDGTYSYVVRMDDPECGENDGNGVEYGIYRWDAGESGDTYAETGKGPFSIVNAVTDTNGDCGLARSVEGSRWLLSGVLERNPGILQIDTGDEVVTLAAVEEVPGQLVGSFEPGTVARTASGTAVRINRVSGAFTVFSAVGNYVSVETQDAPDDGSFAGAEWGCATWGPYELDQTCYPGAPWFLDLNGTGGLSARFEHSYGGINLYLAADWLYMNSEPLVGYLDYAWWKIYGSGS